MKRFALLGTTLVAAALCTVAAYRLLAGYPESEAADSSMVVKQTRATIPARAPDGTPITQLSALAWDKDEQLLYALSDRGTLFHFRVSFSGNELGTVEPVHAAPIRTTRSAAGDRGVDTEDLALANHDNGRKGDTELFVVTERNPGYLHLRASGDLIREMPVPAPLRNPGNFQKANQGLESVLLHPRHGLLTAPEAPLRDAPADMHTLYGEERTWMFERHSPEARLKAMTLLPNGDALVLERTRSPTSKVMIASLRQVSLNDCAPHQTCRVKDEIVLPAERNNFEGLTHIKEQYFLMVNDHNSKDGQGGVLLLLTLPRNATKAL